MKTAKSEWGRMIESERVAQNMRVILPAFLAGMTAALNILNDRGIDPFAINRLSNEIAEIMKENGLAE